MLESVIKRDSETIPYFLSDNLTNHLEAMSCLHDIFKVILRINIDTILEQTVLDNVAQFIDKNLIHCKDLLDKTTYLKCIDHLRFKLYLYADYNLKYEYYEKVHNMQEVAFRIFNKKFKLEEDYDDQDEL